MTGRVDWAGIADAIADLVAGRVVAKLRDDAEPDFIDQFASPLGPRRHVRLIREGKLAGVHVGRRWLARREDVEACLRGMSEGQRGKCKAETTAKGATETPEDLAAELGLTLVAGGAKQ